ncbi:MAG: hypothetical protein JWO67_1068 [Streptosporangiaceae bacterium]|nr:hypothetical protein [Streptosporangiaceae bacterium]
MSTPTWMWIGWIAAFLVLEGIGLFDRKPGGTFSEFMWGLFHVRDRRPTAATWIARVALVLFGTWLTGHIAFGWWTL